MLLGETHIGDVLYNTASLPALHKGLPDCEWHYLAESPAAEVLATNPHLASVINYPRPRFNKPFAVSARIEEVESILREQDFDVAICYNSGMYWRDLLLATRLGVPNRVGYTHKGFSGLVTFPISINYPQPYSAYFRDLVAQVTGYAADWPLRPVIFTTEYDDLLAANTWNGQAFDSAKPVLACFVTTRQPTGVWPAEYFGETLSLLSNRHHVQILLCGAPSDEEKLLNLKKQHHLNCPVLAGQLSLRALVAFLRRCDAVLSTDSGSRHLANAAGVPVFFFRNLRSSRVETGVYCDTEFDLAPDAEFVPPEEQTKRLSNVKPRNIIEVLLEKIKTRSGRCFH